MQFQPDSVRKLFFCLEDNAQVVSCCNYLNCSQTSTSTSTGASSSSKECKIIKNSKSSKQTFSKKVSLKKKFKSKKKTKSESLKLSGPKTRSSTKSKRSIVTKTQYEQLLDNVSASLKSFQYQLEQLSIKQQELSVDRDEIAILKAFETTFQNLHFDINKLNVYIQKNSIKKSSSKPGKDSDYQQQAENMKPSSSKSSKSKTSINYREKLSSDSYFVIRLLHLECNILKYFQLFEAIFNVDISILQSSERFAVLNRLLFNLNGVYYSLLTKLTFSKSPFCVHSSSRRNSGAIFAILVRILNNKKAITSVKDEDFIEIETNDYSLPEIRLKKSSKSSSSNLDPNKCLSSLMFHLEQMVKRDQFATNFASGQSLKQVKLNLISINRENILDFALKSSLVSILRDLFVHFVSKFKNKSTFRQKIIEILAFICMKKCGALDAIAIGSGFIQDLISLLSLMAKSHAKAVFRDLTKMIMSHEPNTPLKAIKKTYLSILKDIYGLLSILLSFTELREGQECLQFHNVAENLYGSFLEPFVEMLNGHEHCDPKHLNVHEPINFEEEPALAYATLNSIQKQHSKMNRYLDRIVGISSIIIQRLLPTLLIPIQATFNPYPFMLPETNDENVSPMKPDKCKKNAKSSDTTAFMNLEDEIDDDQESDCEYDSEAPSVSEPSRYQDDSLLPSYLQFFPEIDCVRRGSKGALNCDCPATCSLSSFLPKRLPINDYANYPTYMVPSEWRENFEYFYGQTASVMPKEEIPFPDANFIYEDYSRNQIQQPMTYPFLDQIPQRKNYHYIKTVEMIQSRFAAKPTLVKLYENAAPSRIESSSYMLPKDESKYLKFDSKFECGNLRCAMVVASPLKPNEEEYILMLSSDVNTTVHTQWFYFSVTNARTDKLYRFKIINLQKKSILYNSGQQPAFYSVTDFQQSSQMWQRLGKDSNVAYYRNHYVKSEVTKMTDKYFTLEFSFNFKHENDKCYFAYNVPYSYTFLRTNILQWKLLVDQHNLNFDTSDDNNEASKTLFLVQSLCSTLKGNDLPVLTITSRANAQSSARPHYVFVTARVHPSESNSSWVMKGFIDSLIMKQKDPIKEVQRKTLLKRYVFKIVPMLNPDGVINGSTRTGLQKVDLNRQWKDPNPLLYPTIYHTKMLMKCLSQHSDGLNPVAYIDLHGHSRQKNIFSYSCSPFSSWKLSDRMQAKNRLNSEHLCSCNIAQNSPCQLKNCLKQIDKDSILSDYSFYFVPPYIMLPFLMYEQQAPCFNINDCSFNIQKDRESSGRIVAWRQLNIPLSYTIECSASGMDVGPYSGYHLDISHLEDMGSNLSSAFSSLHFLRCSNKHVPVIILRKDDSDEENIKPDQMHSERKPSRQQILNKLHKKASCKYSKNEPISVKLIDLYSELNSEIYQACSTSSSVISSVNVTPSSSKPATPRRSKLRRKSRDSCNK